MKNTKAYLTWESLPDILSAQHIALFLGISRRRIYELFQLNPADGGIPNFEIGASKRVLKSDLQTWITDKKQN
ncbi:DNA-binding protein [Lysinibacillus sp. 2017]|uniref:helix-turn-helix domain-containing protein n=1 Tax=unclassified Lysinibacillus TaxID=2636778 RepID=UPI000D52A369|nr:MULTISPECIES: helix-turn-helix domain-containing protein [unclassified Lysinibacillus]AWE08890.1 DNA-binding protein [Lysinibacillus sp. 2017]TGN34726.1 DNA-binding protein [Lysinibacillus sp. S2017]